MNAPQSESTSDSPNQGAVWKSVLLGAMAGGLAWGIRGQYGHETGAMIAGALVSWTLLLICAAHLQGIHAARAIAWCTIAMGFGGSMTYGQTIGLTQNAPVLGNEAAWRWGMLGLGIKGALWISFAGAFLGMGLSGIRYRTRSILLLMATLVGLYFIGCAVLNSPFDPAHKVLPPIYFSADWKWEPNATTLKPRAECWGGMFFALLGTLFYARVRRKDALALRLAGWGALGGLIGFPLGQSIQSYHAWHPERFQQGIWTQLAPHINWWNMMETTFGATMGAMLGLGLWLNRNRIHPISETISNTTPSSSPAQSHSPTESEPLHSPFWGWLFLALHVCLLLISEFGSVPAVNHAYDIGLIQGILPMVLVAWNRHWAFWIALPITALPIAGKTFHQLIQEEHVIPQRPGALLYLVLPVMLTVGTAMVLNRAMDRGATMRELGWRGLMVTTWLYFGLNYAFFRFPWPWEPWTVRTPNALIFTVAALGLTWICLEAWKGRTSAGKGR